MPEDARITVFYDGACPLCRREIAFYRRQKGAEAISWVDVADGTPGKVAPGLTREQALKRFHVLDRTGGLLEGAEAFARLWIVLPRFRPLGRLLQISPFTWLAERAYNGFLLVRPWLQAFLSHPVRKSR